jgi:hypothetical protein
MEVGGAGRAGQGRAMLRAPPPHASHARCCRVSPARFFVLPTSLVCTRPAPDPHTLRTYLLHPPTTQYVLQRSGLGRALGLAFAG